MTSEQQKPVNNSFCKEHYGFRVRLKHLEDENKVQWGKMKTMGEQIQKSDKKYTAILVSTIGVLLVLLGNIILKLIG